MCEEMWLAPSTRLRKMRALAGTVTPAACSMASDAAMECETGQTPQMRSVM